MDTVWNDVFVDDDPCGTCGSNPVPVCLPAENLRRRKLSVPPGRMYPVSGDPGRDRQLLHMLVGEHAAWKDHFYIAVIYLSCTGDQADTEELFCSDPGGTSGGGIERESCEIIPGSDPLALYLQCADCH